MSAREVLRQEIEDVPEPLAAEILDFVRFLKAKATDSGQFGRRQHSAREAANWTDLGRANSAHKAHAHRAPSARASIHRCHALTGMPQEPPTAGQVWPNATVDVSSRPLRLNPPRIHQDVPTRSDRGCGSSAMGVPED